jgi:hypothetical protein
MIPHLSRAGSIERTEELGCVEPPPEPAPEPVAIAAPADLVLDLRGAERAQPWSGAASLFWTDRAADRAPDRESTDRTYADAERRPLVRWEWWLRVVTWLRAPA